MWTVHGRVMFAFLVVILSGFRALCLFTFTRFFTVRRHTHDREEHSATIGGCLGYTPDGRARRRLARGCGNRYIRVTPVLQTVIDTRQRRSIGGTPPGPGH